VKEDPPLDFTKEVKYNLGGVNEAVNSSSLEPNIYLASLDYAIKFDIRYALYLTQVDKKHELARKVLLDTEKLASRTIGLSPSLK